MKTAAGDNNTNKEEAKNAVDGIGSHLNLLAGINRFISHNNTLKDPHNLNSNTKEEKPVTSIANQPNEQNEQQQSSVFSRNNGRWCLHFVRRNLNRNIMHSMVEEI